jgi:integrase
VATSASTAWADWCAFAKRTSLSISSVAGALLRHDRLDMAVVQRADRANEWWVDFRWRGTRIRKRAPVQTKRGAEAFERQLRIEFSEDEAHGMNPFSGPPPTFAAFSAEWFDRYVRTRNRFSGQREKASALKHHLIPAFGTLPLDEITTERIDSFAASKVRAGYAPKSVNNLLTILRCCLVVATDWHRLRHVPRVRWLRVPDQPYKSLTEDQLVHLLEAAEPGRWRALILFVADTGVRLGEAAALEWDDVALTAATPCVRICRGSANGVVGPTKTNRTRVLPLTIRVCAELAKLPRQSSRVFPKLDGGVMRSEHAIDGLHRACDRAGIPRVGWHALRHTFATLLCQRGVPLRNVQALLGHTTIVMTSRYAHANTDDLRDWIGRCWSPVAGPSGHQVVTKPRRHGARGNPGARCSAQPSKNPAPLPG